MIKYRPFKGKVTGKIVVVCASDYELEDYEQWRFMRDREGYMVGFDDEEECIQWINDNIKRELIHNDYLRTPDAFYYKGDLTKSEGEVCPVCKGSGRQAIYYADHTYRDSPCGRCDGSGRV